MAERRAALHRRKDVHEARRVTALLEDPLDPILLAKGLEPADELDLDTGLCSNLHGVVTDLLAHRLGPARVVRQPNLVDAQLALHRPGMADVRQRACQNNPVKTRNHPGDISLVTLDEWACHDPTPSQGCRIQHIISKSFGSGYAGLG
ncbi:MAG: hypothetical protein OXH79_18705 [Boseongicola sp.]|nr:hypothetical protein [Boseongicola sp.]